ncbi:MAG: FAD-dependent oxidoreductase [Buchananella hordeovulneris]|nr:FAD-dependent oxidoreductase [Buchananella hordeovulneris]
MKVVVVGGGYAGVAAARELDEVADVVLVEAKDTFVHHAATLRAAVDPDWTDTIFIPYDKLLGRGQVVRGTVMRLEGTKVFVSDGTVIEADAVILATGTASPFPAKLAEDSYDIASARLRRLHQALAQAKRALIVGAGGVGTELAGELTSAYPHLEVVMVEKEDDVLPLEPCDPRLRKELRAQLEARNVELVLGTTLGYFPPVDVGTLSPFEVDTKDGRNIHADIWFRCYGSRVASGYLGPEFDEAKRGDGSLNVDEYMQVVGHPGIFAVGDLAHTVEPDRADAAVDQGRLVASILRDIIEGREPQRTYEPQRRWVLLPLGPEGGACEVRDPGSGEVLVAGAEETARIKGEDMHVTWVRNLLGRD